MIQSTTKAHGTKNGYDGRNLTTHSTGARVSRSFIVELAVAGLCARPVNSGVRFLLNGQAQRHV
jgi:hypothetical protein